jgi:hypothetical protein
VSTGVQRTISKKEHIIRDIRTLPIGKKKVFLAVHLHQLFCRICKSLKLESLLLSFPSLPSNPFLLKTLPV